MYKAKGIIPLIVLKYFDSIKNSLLRIRCCLKDKDPIGGSFTQSFPKFSHFTHQVHINFRDSYLH